jgi:polar amino acid transport system ATP-binding protein
MTLKNSASTRRACIDRADGMTMVVVTHEMGFARSTADSVVFMDHGKVVESGTPDKIFTSAEADRLQRFLSQVL